MIVHRLIRALIALIVGPSGLPPREYQFLSISKDTVVFFGHGRRLSRGRFIRSSNARVTPVYLRRFYVNIVRGNKAKVKGKIRNISVKFLMLAWIVRPRSSTQFPTDTTLHQP